MRRSDRIFQQRQLQAITKQLGGSAYAQGRIADLIDMHLTRRGLCIVTIEERNLLPHPTHRSSAESIDHMLGHATVDAGSESVPKPGPRETS